MVNLDIKKKMALILSVGQILAENGAATDKIISNTKRVATLMKIPEENFNIYSAVKSTVFRRYHF